MILSPHVRFRLGIMSGVVNFGVDLRVIGPRPDGSPWEVGIHHPHHGGELLASAIFIKVWSPPVEAMNAISRWLESATAIY